ncbi:hypothetical protein LTR08_006073 [Meristemomyces frigidus]|nr:hypothetical protein LTR08_006073 [Meristemomyces frigidus]
MTSQDAATTSQQSDRGVVSVPSDTSSSSPAPVATTEETSAAPAAPPNPRLAALAVKRANLDVKLADLQARRSALVTEAKLPSGLDMPADWSDDRKTKQALSSANVVIKEHIGLLHKYNEMKDIAQGLMGLIADKRGVRIANVMEDFDMGEKD